MTLFKVKDERHLLKDTHSKAVLNTDDQELAAYKKRRKKRIEEKQQIVHLEKKVDRLENKLDLVLELLLKNDSRSSDNGKVK